MLLGFSLSILAAMEVHKWLWNRRHPQKNSAAPAGK